MRLSVERKTRQLSTIALALATVLIGATHAAAVPPPATPTPLTANLGDLPEGKTVTIKFSVTVNNPPAAGLTQVQNQGTVTGTGFTVLTDSDDPSLTGASDPTVTTVTRPTTTITSIGGAGSSPTNAATVAWTVTFADPVLGLTAGNLALVNVGLTGAPAITGVNAVGGTTPATMWAVTASTGSGNGTLQLNFATDAGLSHIITTPPAGDTYVVDLVAPDTLFDTPLPSNPSSSASATFTFHGDDGTGGSGINRLECQLDGGGFAPCTSPRALSGLADGSHTFQVRAVDTAGNVDATPLSVTWVVDTAPPNTSFTATPSNPTATGTASLSFVGNDGSGSGIASFECKLDSGAFTACTSPQALSGLADGSHTFQVRAKDNVGLTDPTPASYTWVVDTTAPETTIDAPKPANPTNDPSATFTFHGDDGSGGSGGLTFTCQLDGGGFTPCTSPKSYVSLADGSHTFQAKAKDAAGNVAATPASFTWTVDATPPDTFIDNKPNNPANSTTASFQFHGDDGSGVGGLAFECKLDIGAFTGCTTSTTQSYAGLAEGSHTFQVRAKDSLVNTDETPASYTWTVDTLKPTVSVGSSAPSPTGTSPIHITITFNEAVTGFTPTTASGDVVLGGVGGTTSNPAGSGASYSFDLTPNGQGAVTVQVPAGSAQDAATNLNDVSNTFSITYDTTRPTVTINQAAGQLDPAHGTGAVKFTVVFSEAVNGFAGADVTLSGTALPTTATVTPVSGTTYTVAVSGMSKSGTVIASIAAGAAQDSAGNLTLAATSTDNTVTYFRNEISDFNGDGKSDLIWQDPNGTPVVWYLNGAAFGTSANIVFSGPPAGWRIVGVGDFNGDGQVDIVAQKGDTVSIGVMNGKTVQSTQVLPTLLPSGWFVRAVADFDGDGQSDLVLQNLNGAVVVWFMNGNPATKKGGAVIFDSALPGWTVLTAADFTGDGQPDILLQHDNGTVVVWPMNGTTRGTGIVVTGPIPGWTLRTAADLDGDGQTDLLWQDTDGRVVAWLMNGTTRMSGVTIYPSPLPGWTIQTAR